jgi:hypothetical protein
LLLLTLFVLDKDKEIFKWAVFFHHLLMKAVALMWSPGLDLLAHQDVYLEIIAFAIRESKQMFMSLYELIISLDFFPAPVAIFGSFVHFLCFWSNSQLCWLFCPGFLFFIRSESTIVISFIVNWCLLAYSRTILNVDIIEVTKRFWLILCQHFLDGCFGWIGVTKHVFIFFFLHAFMICSMWRFALK